MADPVKSDEIEDVLSSIRRLVTEHQPPVGVADSAAPEPAADKLVLTPALRVMDPEDPWVPIATQSDLSEDAAELPRSGGVDWAEDLWGDGNPGDNPEFDPQLQADIRDRDETIAAPAPEATPEPAGAEEAMINPDQRPILPAQEPAKAVGDIIEAEQIEASAAEFSDIPEGPEATDGVQGEDAPLSFIRSSSSVIEYEPEEGNTAIPDGEPPVATVELAEARAAQMAVAGVLSEIAADPAEAGSEADPQDGAEAGSEVPDGPDEATAAIVAEPTAELETPVINAPDAPDFLAEEEPDPAPAPEAQNDAERSEAIEDLGESPFSFPDDDVSIVDEEMLREIISDVVREELRGEMGKRITRNIRKLVRREIRIALATDELDD